MSEPADDLRSQFRAVMRRHHDMTATAVTSLSLDPPSLPVCVNHDATHCGSAPAVAAA